MEITLSPRERLLETAYRLFYSQGFNLTGINQILDEAKVAKATLYQHFKSKEELGTEYIKKVRVDWFSSFDTFISRTERPEDQILGAFEFLEINMTLNEYRGCRFLNLLSEIDSTSKEMQTQILEHKTKLRCFFRELIQKCLGKDKQLEFPEQADTIYLLFEAAIIESKVFKDKWPIRSAKNAVSSILKSI